MWLMWMMMMTIICCRLTRRSTSLMNRRLGTALMVIVMMVILTRCIGLTCCNNPSRWRWCWVIGWMCNRTDRLSMVNNRRNCRRQNWRSYWMMKLMWLCRHSCRKSINIWIGHDFRLWRGCSKIWIKEYGSWTQWYVVKWRKGGWCSWG